MNLDRETGKVKFFNITSGYGFIIPDNESSEVFFHITQCDGKNFDKDDRVEYSIGDGKKGPCALEIKKIK